MSEFHTGSWWADTQMLLGIDFVQNAILAALLLGIISGAIAPLIVMRKMSFMAHSTGELALMGASAALLFGFGVSWGAVLGAVLAALVLTALGNREQDAIVAVVLSFGMGLSVLFIHLYPGRSTEAFSLLTGQIVGVSNSSLGGLALLAVIAPFAFFAEPYQLFLASLGVLVIVAVWEYISLKALAATGEGENHSE